MLRGDVEEWMLWNKRLMTYIEVHARGKMDVSTDDLNVYFCMII